MATITKTVKPAGGGDYSTLAGAISDLSTQVADVVLNCFAGSLGVGMNLSGGSFTSLTINAVDKHSGVSTTVAGLNAFSYLSTTFSVFLVPFPVSIVGIACATASGKIQNRGCSSLLLDSLLFQDATVVSTVNTATGFISTLLRNCAFYGPSIFSATTSSGGNNPSSFATLLNCSVWSSNIINTSRGDAGAVGVVNAINCASMKPSTSGSGFLDSPSNGATASTSLTNCCYNKATVNGFNVNPQVSVAATEYTSQTNMASAGSTSLIRDNGVAQGSFSTDIVGVLRPQNHFWDIGAFEFPVAYDISNLGIPYIGFCIHG